MSVDLIGRARSASLRAQWPTRRLVAVGFGAPGVLALLVATSGGWGGGITPGWLALVTLNALAVAAIVATYVPLPGTGRRLEVGCMPCAVVAPLSVLVSVGLVGSVEHDVPSAMLALGVAAFGFRQRLTNASSCAA
ncbi:MAG: hypothetical protein ACOH17_10995 [Cellulomonas sp.]